MGPTYEVPSHPGVLWTVTDCFARGDRTDPNNVYVELTDASPVPSDDFERDTISMFARDFARTSILVGDPTDWYSKHHPEVAQKLEDS